MGCFTLLIVLIQLALRSDVVVTHIQTFAWQLFCCRECWTDRLTWSSMKAACCCCGNTSVLESLLTDSPLKTTKTGLRRPSKWCVRYSSHNLCPRKWIHWIILINFGKLLYKSTTSFYYIIIKLHYFTSLNLWMPNLYMNFDYFFNFMLPSKVLEKRKEKIQYKLINCSTSLLRYHWCLWWWIKIFKLSSNLLACPRN